MGRGVYRLAEMPAPEHPDLVTVTLMVPAGVICLLSALSFHELTTEIPHAVRVYCLEKTLADIFKLRNRVGMDTVLEAIL